jgi:hypothetical protein
VSLDLEELSEIPPRHRPGGNTVLVGSNTKKPLQRLIEL